MNILIAHNRYLIHGGEDAVVNSERKMLDSNGHKVVYYERSNDEFNRLNPLGKIFYFLKDVYFSRRTYTDIVQIIGREKIELVHVHNTFMSISPSIYQACQDKHVPIVQTLHNYRFLCPVGTFFRDGKVCENCLTKGRQEAVLHRCWKDSYIFSWIITKVVGEFYRKNILAKVISRFIVLSGFSLKKYIDQGFDQKKFSVKPNFLNVDSQEIVAKENYAVFVGGLHPYKGIATLLKAWGQVPNSFELKIIGDGPLKSKVEQSLSCGNIKYYGYQKSDQVLEILKKAKFVIVPSECFENFPRVVIEAFACGSPVIATNIGVFPELIQDGKTGLLFKYQDSADLFEKIKQLINDEILLKELSLNTRKEFEKKYTSEQNYKLLLDIYQQAILSYNPKLC